MKELSSKPTSIPRKLLLYALFALLVLAAVGCRRSTPFPPDTVPRFAQTVAEFTFKVGQPVSLILPAAAGGQEPLVYRLEQVPPGLAFDAATRTLSGMPTTPGTYRLPYQVVDVDGDQDTQTIIVAVPVTDCEEWNSGTFFETATLERVTDCLWAGAEVNARDRRRNTPLHFAASATDDPLIVAALLEAGADLRARNVDGAEPLHGAANNENPDITESLLAAGADVHARTYSRRTALHWAARNNDNPTVIELLTAAGADVRAADNFGETPLHRAAQYTDNPAVIGALLEAGSELQAEHRLGGSPLHIGAAFNPNPEIISTLLDAGADLEARNSENFTPLHSAAAFNRNPAVVALLL